MEKDLAGLAERAAQPGIGIFSASLKKSGSGWHFVVEIDGLNDPRGSVSVDDCEEFSRRFSTAVDEEINAGTAGVLPSGLTPDNYSMEVGSAGAERELRLPGDLERFKGQPLKIRFREGEKDKHELVVYIGTGPEADPKLNFERYTGKKRKKSGGASGRTQNLAVAPGDLLKANLYLDF
ncbi:MAG: hypothetical protein HY042_07915 [Spirochaetia bacterium]|nr:hypothetical protein [Spirochaetia bacterium]